MRAGSVASISQVCPHLTKKATAVAGGSGRARAGTIGMLGPAISLVVGATSMQKMEQKTAKKS
uniref:Uncharacterized protein n=1 Tax=Romanomermis culicivorax TaxID=13658 RepID=A0A915KZC1_ROMCU